MQVKRENFRNTTEQLLLNLTESSTTRRNSHALAIELITNSIKNDTQQRQNSNRSAVTVNGVSLSFTEEPNN